MCGIIGYTGRAGAVPKITKGLSVLEYRGYDSVGLAARIDEGIRTVKCRGRVGALEERLRGERLAASRCAIGHTRWATHGGPSDVNAHPHRVGDVVLVHNGIIENYKELKAELEGAGVSFLSETDTEVAAAHIHAHFDASGDPLAAIRAATATMTGSYAFGILFEGYPEQVWAARRGSPLLLAKGEDGFYLASDLTALLPFSKEYYVLGEGEIARLTPNAAEVCDQGGEWRAPQWRTSTLTPESAQKGGFAHFMCKEIHEQPDAIAKSVSPRVRRGLPCFESDGIDADFWRRVKQIQIVACGSATHAGLLGCASIERVAGIPAASYTASEYRYHPPIAPNGTLVVLISQSGETADTLAALRYAKEVGLPTLAIVNAVETTIAREADYRIYTFAGPEIAVATTKGYCTQVAILDLIAAAIAYANRRIGAAQARRLVQELLVDAPAAIRKMLDESETFQRIARRLALAEHAFYIGRGGDFAISQEAALKLKEISYVHAEGYAAGELKHGTISLVEENTPVLAISTEGALFDKLESNVREVRSRGAHVTLLCRDDAKDPGHSADEVILLPANSEAATRFAAITAIQLIAYETAVCRGCDVDRPRNLAKSVTVE